jgi:hypothetical protein
MSIAHLVGLTAIATIWLGAKPTVGYLARVGPAPLRFQPPPKAAEVTVALPPLAMKDPEPVIEYYGPPAPLEEPIVTTVTSSTNAAPVQPQVAAPDVSALSPQMLIQYFNDRSRSNQDYSVLLPFNFSPPPAATIPPPPSKATYQSK